jgi:uncharacterized protein (DUF169 family)
MEERQTVRSTEQIKAITEILKLQSTPIGVRFSETQDEQGVERQLRICEALDLVRRENVVINISRENCTCSGGRHYAGWQPLSLEELASLYLAANVYNSKQVAESSVGKQLQPKYRGRYLILGPLDKFKTDPDAILLFANPAQADRILGLASFEGSQPFTHYPASSMCSTINNALTKEKPYINLISMFERAKRNWSPNELIMVLPFRDFMTAVRSVGHSGYGKRDSSL